MTDFMTACSVCSFAVPQRIQTVYSCRLLPSLRMIPNHRLSHMLDDKSSVTCYENHASPNPDLNPAPTHRASITTVTHHRTQAPTTDDLNDDRRPQRRPSRTAAMAAAIKALNAKIRANKYLDYFCSTREFVSFRRVEMCHGWKHLDVLESRRMWGILEAQPAVCSICGRHEMAHQSGGECKGRWGR